MEERDADMESARAAAAAAAADGVALAAVLCGSTSAKALSGKCDDFVTRLKRRQFAGSFELAQETLKLVRLLVNVKRWKTPAELLQVVRAFGRRLVRARPMELVVGNVVRRVLFAIKEEYFSMLQEAKESAARDQAHSSQTPQPQTSPPTPKGETELDPSASLWPRREVPASAAALELPTPADWNLRAAIVEAVTEMLGEMENMMEPISAQALEHVHADDTVLVYGASATVRAFLAAAKKKRAFKVIVAEAAPDFTGQRMAKELAALGIETILIPDSAVFALMARVNKVVLGARAIVANGGLLSAAGAHVVALAAKHHTVPVMCVSGLYKICPMFPHDRDSLIDLKSPGPTLSYASLGALADRVQVLAPACDYVPPDLVDLFVTNTGGHQPSYIYRLLAESYDVTDEDELL